MKKYIWLIALVMILAANLLACAAPPPTPAPAPAPTPAPAQKMTYNWKMANDQSPESPISKEMDLFAARVKELSNDRINITPYHSGVLGDWIAVREEVMRGTIEMDSSCLASIYDPRLDVVYIPYLVQTWDEVRRVYSPGGYVFDKVNGIGEEMGYKTLGSMPLGFIGMATTKMPVSPGDPEIDKTGVKIRVWPAIPPEKLIARLGYQVVTLPWSEVYTAMQTGAVDGAFGADSVSAYDTIRDVTKYWLDYRGFFECHFFMMNFDLWSSLDSEDQGILMQAAAEAQERKTAAAEDLENQSYALWEEYGVEVVKFSPEEMAKFREVTVADVWPEMNSLLGKMVMDEAKAAVGMGE